MKIKLHYSLLGLIIIFLFSGLYKEIFLFFLIIILHELGHVLSLIIFKQKIKVLNITLIGGILDVDYHNLKIYQEVVIALAGIFVNIILLLISYEISDSYYSNLLINYNLLLICFNIIPIYPLDGYRLFEGLFRLKNNPFAEQKYLIFISSLMLSCLFVAIFFYFKNLTLFIIFLFLLYKNIKLNFNRTSITLKKLVSRYRYN